MKTAENISDPILLEQFIVIADFKKTERNQVILSNQKVLFVFIRFSRKDSVPLFHEICVLKMRVGKSVWKECEN